MEDNVKQNLGKFSEDVTKYTEVFQIKLNQVWPVDIVYPREAAVYLWQGTSLCWLHGSSAAQLVYYRSYESTINRP